MALIIKENALIEYVTGDTLPVNDVIIGTKARNIDTNKYVYWAGAEWVDFYPLSTDKVNWANEYVPKMYQKNDMVRDATWLVIANKDTHDRPAPQADGDKIELIDKGIVSFTDVAKTALVRSGHDYTFTKSGWLNKIELIAPVITENTKIRLIILDITDIENVTSKILNGFTLVNNEWQTVYVGKYIVRKDTTLRFILEIEDHSTDTVLMGDWTYVSGTPGSGEWTEGRRNTVRINVIDADGNDRRADLMSGTINTKFKFTQKDDDTKSIFYVNDELPSDEGDYIEFKTTTLDEGVAGIPDDGALTAATSNIPAPNSVHYLEDVDYVTDNPNSLINVVGLVELDGVMQPGTAGNAYGINIVFQKAYVSADWDILSHTDNSSGGLSDHVEQIQTDWNITDNTNVGYIKNKPITISSAQALAISNNTEHSDSLHAPSNAEKNVQSNWSESDAGKNSFILNKPPLAPSDAEKNVQSDWSQSDTSADDFIKNKPNVTGFVPLAGGDGAGKRMTGTLYGVGVLMDGDVEANGGHTQSSGISLAYMPDVESHNTPIIKFRGYSDYLAIEKSVSLGGVWGNGTNSTLQITTAWTGVMMVVYDKDDNFATPLKINADTIGIGVSAVADQKLTLGKAFAAYSLTDIDDATNNIIPTKEWVLDKSGGLQNVCHIGSVTDTTITANDFILNSDVVLKDNIDDLSAHKLRPVIFDWKATGVRDIGFIAQEVEEFYPEVVSEFDGIKRLSYSKITAINAARINELEDENKDLKDNIELMKERLARLEKLMENFI